MITAYSPFGYNEMTLPEQKKVEYLVSLILYPYEKEKKETFSDSEIKFLTIFIYFFKNQTVSTRVLMNKMFAHSVTNYKILNHFVALHLIDQVQRGVYKLSDKVVAALDKIQKEIAL